MSACDKEQLLLLSYGELPADQASAVEQHVAGCAECAAELAHLREAVGLLDRLPAPELSAAAMERIAEAGRAAVARRRGVIHRPSWLWRYRFAAAAAAVLAVAIGLSVLVAPPRSSEPPALATAWDRPMDEGYENASLVEELSEHYEGDAWGEAQMSLTAEVGSSDTGGDLLEIEETLDQLDALSWDS